LIVATSIKKKKHLCLHHFSPPKMLGQIIGNLTKELNPQSFDKNTCYFWIIKSIDFLAIKMIKSIVVVDFKENMVHCPSSPKSYFELCSKQIVAVKYLGFYSISIKIIAIKIKPWLSCFLAHHQGSLSQSVTCRLRPPRGSFQPCIQHLGGSLIMSMTYELAL
jgi:hypothetical protein